MDSEHVKGAIDKAKGAVKDAAGGLIGDAQLQAEGKLDKAKGAAHSAAGDVNDVLDDAAAKAKAAAAKAKAAAQAAADELKK
jgi:uncharacterized protein YjbJ (UPF0337 family)